MKTMRIVLPMFALLFLIACSSVPELDHEAPVIWLQLSTWYTEGNCPMSVVFSLNPNHSSDNVSSLDECRIRYDFDDDGQWDTEFEEPVLRQWEPEFNLPAGQWVVKCELKDAMGNSAVHTETLDMPAWTPTAPDVIAGRITLQGFAPNEPHPAVRAGVPVRIFLVAQDWINDEDILIHQAYFLDDVLIGELERSPRLCPSNLCCASIFELDDGWTEVGLHDLRIEVTIEGNSPDTDPSNNSPSTVIEVIAPGEDPPY